MVFYVQISRSSKLPRGEHMSKIRNKRWYIGPLNSRTQEVVSQIVGPKSRRRITCTDGFRHTLYECSPGQLATIKASKEHVWLVYNLLVDTGDGRPNMWGLVISW